MITGELSGAVCSTEECMPFHEKFIIEVDVAAK
jgi:hypothetical protein